MQDVKDGGRLARPRRPLDALEHGRETVDNPALRVVDGHGRRPTRRAGKGKRRPAHRSRHGGEYGRQLRLLQERQDRLQLAEERPNVPQHMHAGAARLRSAREHPQTEPLARARLQQIQVAAIAHEIPAELAQHLGRRDRINRVALHFVDAHQRLVVVRLAVVKRPHLGQQVLLAFQQVRRAGFRARDRNARRFYGEQDAVQRLLGAAVHHR